MLRRERVSPSLVEGAQLCLSLRVLLNLDAAQPNQAEVLTISPRSIRYVQASRLVCQPATL